MTNKKKNDFKKTTFLIFILILSHNVFSQTTIWLEDFESYTNGTVTGNNNNTTNPASDWTSGGCTTCPASAADWWEVQDGEMEARDVNSERVFLQTEVIDITGYPSIDFFVDIREAGDLEGLYQGADNCTDAMSEDYADVEYRIDNGPWILISNYLSWCGLYASCGTHTLYGDDGTASGDCRTTDGDWGATTVQVLGLMGTTLEIRLSATNGAGSEYIRFDNILVEGCIIPVGATLSQDEICTAENLGTVPDAGSVTTAVSNQTNSCSTDNNDPEPNAWTSEQGVWFRFLAPTSGHVTIDAISNGASDPIDLQLAVYESDDNTCTGTIVELGSSYDNGSFDENLRVGCLVAGNSYWLFLDGESTTDGTGIFDVTITDAGVYAVPNDQVCSAISLGEPVSPLAMTLSTQNNFCATNTLDANPTWSNEMGVWYTFIAPASEIVQIDITSLAANEIDLQIAVFDSDDMTCTGVMTEVKSSYSTSEPTANPLSEELVVGCLVASRTYYILVDGEGTTDLLSGLFDISISETLDTVDFIRN